MNLINKPLNPTLLFIRCVGLGILSFIICTIVLLSSNGGMEPSSFSIEGLPKSLLVSVQAIQMITLFIIPPILYALFSKNEFLTAFRLDKQIEWKKYLLSLTLALLLFPFIIWLASSIESLPFPPEIRKLADMQNALLESAMKMLLDSPDPGNFIVMLVLLGLGAGLTEELFFRGLLMPILWDLFNNRWAGIVLSALIFSALHMSIYNFVPISFIGIMFGYLYHKTQDLKLNIFIHSVFNGFQVVLNYLKEINLLSTDIQEIKTFPLSVALLCAVASYFVFIKIIKLHE